MSWTDDRVELLKKLWGEGHTAAEIAKKLGNVTRNAVIGKAHRLKLPSRVSPIQPNKTKKIRPANSNVKVVKPVEVKEKKPREAKLPPTASVHDKAVGPLVPLSELKAGDCRWPSGDPRHNDFGFCGEKSMTGLPYCIDHAQSAYQAATRNRILKATKADETGTEPSKKQAAQ